MSMLPRVQDKLMSLLVMKLTNSLGTNKIQTIQVRAIRNKKTWKQEYVVMKTAIRCYIIRATNCGFLFQNTEVCFKRFPSCQ